jgi:NTP pyrophosphatase (non-canonical NTP hydrolase)
MDLNDYQRRARSTAIYPKPLGNLPVYPALKLAGEAGEVAEKIGKILRDEEGVIGLERGVELAYELGDVLWYVANLASDLGYDLDNIAQMNVEKLASRQFRGVIKGSGDNR